jgi:hypothetical protein
MKNPYLVNTNTPTKKVRPSKSYREEFVALKKLVANKDRPQSQEETALEILFRAPGHVANGRERTEMPARRCRKR